MVKFCDEWVVDRTLFEYVSGGSCACCGFPHMFPDGTKGLINAISDLETDAAQAEVSALDRSPWPPDMRDQVWADRLRLRHKLKREMKEYKQFWDDHGEALQHWCRSTEPKKLAKLLQIPRAEIMDRVNNAYGIHSAFGVVLCTVVEQVVHFKDTKYPMDARGQSETEFERILKYDRRGGFTLKGFLNQDRSLNEEILNIWMKRMESLGGPKLLERGPSTSQKNHEEEDDDDTGGVDEAHERDPEDTKPGPSFRVDRRVIRLIIARYWADQFKKVYLSEIESKKDCNQDD